MPVNSKLRLLFPALFSQDALAPFPDEDGLEPAVASLEHPKFFEPLRDQNAIAYLIDLASQTRPRSNLTGTSVRPRARSFRAIRCTIAGSCLAQFSEEFSSASRKWLSCRAVLPIGGRRLAESMASKVLLSNGSYERKGTGIKQRMITRFLAKPDMHAGV